MAESQQHKLDRVRRPRVQITYDVETNGAMETKQLPFVVGVLADLSGHNKPAKPLKEREFVFIDRDNLNDVLAKAAPELSIRVANTLTNDNTQLAVNLKFKHMDDFEPAHVAKQVEPLKRILEMRERLEQVLVKMQTKPELEKLLEDVLSNTEKVRTLAKQMGIEPAAQ